MYKTKVYTQRKRRVLHSFQKNEPQVQKDFPENVLKVSRF